MSNKEYVQNLLNDKFDIIEVLGKGGYGCVWKARYKTNGKVCAIKQKRFTGENLGNIEDLFRKQIEAGIKHQNVIELYELISKPPELFLIMEYCKGGTLEEKLEDNRRDKQRFTEETSLFIIKQICQGVKAIHEKGYYHRDINPKNILMSGNRIIISDLGLIKKSYEKSSNLKGAAQYIPVEQQEPDKKTGLFNADSRSDIFTVGVIFYELLSGGYKPFMQIHSEKELIEMKRNVSYINRLSIHGVNERFLRIIRKCLQPIQDDRYQSVQEILDDLEGKISESKHLRQLDSMNHEVLNYLKRKTKYGTSALQDVSTIINRRRNIQTYIKSHDLPQNTEISRRLQEVDNAIIKKRIQDYEHIWNMGRPDKDIYEVQKTLIKKRGYRYWHEFMERHESEFRLYYQLCKSEYWDFSRIKVDPMDRKEIERDCRRFIDYTLINT